MLKKSIQLFVFIMFVCSIGAFAQTQFIEVGYIEFEKKVNMHKNLGNDTWAESMKSRLPQFSTTYYDLRFNKMVSSYKVGREVEDPWKKMWGGQQDLEDIVRNDYENLLTVSQKQVFEKTYLLTDSLVNVEWRITDETRDIAGFECRKAVGRLYDSIYVVAFYTPQIITPGGPGNFNGLPGMILGLAIPRFSTTLFATKLVLTTPTEKDLALPTKGKKATRTEMQAQVKEAVKRWGDNWQKEYYSQIL